MVQIPHSYSLPQKTLHWLMAALIFFNLLVTEGIEQWNRAARRGETLEADQLFSANLHAYVGIAILVLAVLRLVLRIKQGAPAAPEAEPPLFRLLAKLAHAALYALFILMPVTGLMKYYADIDLAGDLHADVLKVVLWLIVAGHVGAVLVHRFVWKTDVATRMTSG